MTDRLMDVPTNDPVERAAIALYERDAKRSVGLASRPWVWPRVRGEYRQAAKAALAAAAEEDR